MSEKPAKTPQNLLWALDEIIIALQHFRERLKRLAAEAKSS
jgi:hypothetical protein